MVSRADILRPASPPGKAMQFKKTGESLGLSVASIPDLIREVTRGFPYEALTAFEKNSGVSLPLLAEMVGIPERTLARRRSAGRLASKESERLLRLSFLFDRCVELFEGDVASAVQWLATPQRTLENRTPLQYARTEIGTREVENLIGRLEHGVFS
jgi:putative toxin-antitoxin system antitoxin component (TIGR02293 family)